jgi:hypothetical protein
MDGEYSPNVPEGANWVVRTANDALDRVSIVGKWKSIR